MPGNLPWIGRGLIAPTTSDEATIAGSRCYFVVRFFGHYGITASHAARRSLSEPLIDVLHRKLRVIDVEGKTAHNSMQVRIPY